MAAREEWRPVVGYEDLYLVSSLGRVRRIGAARGSIVGRILKPLQSPAGYPMAALSRFGKQRRLLVHRLVAAAFIGPCPSGHQVNHKNGSRTDNRLRNLEYVTPSENIQHALHVLKTIPTGERHYYRISPEKVRRGEACGRTCSLTSEQVLEIRRRYAAGGVAQMDLAEEFHVSLALISKIIRRSVWAHLPSEQTGPYRRKRAVWRRSRA